MLKEDKLCLRFLFVSCVWVNDGEVLLNKNI